MKKIVFFFAVCYVIAIIASPTRSSVAARQSAMVSDGEEVSIPYVTEGLVAMYDGEWNAGVGLHNANAYKLKNLSGDKSLDLELQGSYEIGDCYVRFTGGYGIAGKYDFVGRSGATMSVVAKFDTTEGSSLGWSYPGNVSRLCITYSSPYWYLVFGGQPGNPILRENLVTNEVVKYDFVWDVSNELIKLYRNGVLIRSTSNSYLSSTSYVTAFNSQIKNHFRMMAYGNDKDTGIYGKTSHGTVFSCLVYAKALTDEEIAFNHDIDVERFGN